MISLFLLAYFFQVLKYWLALLHSAYITIIPFSKYLITSMSTIFYINSFVAKIFNTNIGPLKLFLWIILVFNFGKI